MCETKLDSETRLKQLSHPQKGASKPKNSPYFTHKRLYINHLAWYDPISPTAWRPLFLRTSFKIAFSLLSRLSIDLYPKLLSLPCNINAHIITLFF